MFPSANARRESERRIIEDGTAIWRTKRKFDLEKSLREKRELREMLAAYNPWGKPGNGAPMPGALRKTKWLFQEPAEAAASVMTLGRPGHGAPLRTISGKIKTLLKADPSIRFQAHEPSRRSVENDLRYRASPADKENYRKELDAIVEEKHKRGPEDPGSTKVTSKTENLFATSKMVQVVKGWTDEVAFRRLVKSLPKGETDKISDASGGGGVELVPLLAKNRMVNRSPLSSTDVTRISKIQNGPPKTGMNAEYQRHLSKQISEKQHMLQAERREDLEMSRKHFETWKGFWGRPGHGAPKALSQREKLEMILYYLPARRNSAKKSN